MDHGEQCDMKGGTEFDGSDFFADKAPEPDWEKIAERRRVEALSLWMQRNDQTAMNSRVKFQRDALAVVMFAVGLSLGWLAAVFL